MTLLLVGLKKLYRDYAMIANSNSIRFDAPLNKADDWVFHRTNELVEERCQKLYVRTDRLFALLMVLQWVGAMVAAVVISPLTWVGAHSNIHPHLYASIFLGGILALGPIFLAVFYPGRPITRYVIASAQMLFSALLIHLSGGRIETHFHVFGSLAFLSFYRDWRVLVPATIVVAVDHLARGIFWPESVFGVITPAPWRAIEHAAWVIFEDIFLVVSCVSSARETRLIASNQVALEKTNAAIEEQVEDRTRELSQKTDALQNEMQERQALEGQLLQAQKLETIGQLAAGIAHEINTPLQYISDNNEFLRDQFTSLLQVIDKYAQQIDPDAPKRSWADRVEEVQTTLEELDYEFLKEEIPQALAQTMEGLERVTTIVQAMKEFSHPGSALKEGADLNRAIETTTTVCRNRWKNVAQLEMALDPDLPTTPCLIAEFNQVILNLVVNAADAIGEKQDREKSKQVGVINVSTHCDGDWVEVRVKDTGGGIPEKIQERIFDPFFTSKEVGKGTGQGLAISRNVIVEKHGGDLRFETVEGEGTTFIIRLPLQENESMATDQEAA